MFNNWLSQITAVGLPKWQGRKAENFVGINYHVKSIALDETLNPLKRLHHLTYLDN